MKKYLSTFQEQQTSKIVIWKSLPMKSSLVREISKYITKIEREVRREDFT